MFLSSRTVFDPVNADQGRPGPGSWLRGRWFPLESGLRWSVCAFCVPAVCKLIPSIPDGAKEIVGIRHSVAHECLSVKHSNSHGYWLLTEDQALFALLCHNDAASLI